MSDFNPQERVKKMVAAIKNEVLIHFIINSLGKGKGRTNNGQCSLII